MRNAREDWHAGMAEETEMTLRITVISAWQLPRIGGEKGEIIDPYIVTSIAGVPQDNASSKTKVVKNNGMNPVFYHDAVFKIHVPDLACVTLRVYDSDRFSADDFIAYAGLPVTSLRSGYRHVPLFNYKDVSLSDASVFVRIVIT